MKLFRYLAWLICVSGTAHAVELVKGFSLTEIGEHRYDASLNLDTKTEAQNIVDRAYRLGARHINLSPRAIMRDPRGSELVPMTPLADRAAERDRYRRLIGYIKGKGMTVGIRPLFFVVDSMGRTPFKETLPDGTTKTWWHGNIQPADPNAWFESFKTYLDIYLTIAKITHADEFTLAAELYSMTIGVEDQWKEYPYGFPGRWLEVLNYSRAKLGTGTRIMYDINFTDDKAIGPSASEFGGELARWRYRLVDLANPTPPEEKKIWENLRDFWNGLDAVGIDMYRSLGSRNINYSNMNFSQLTSALQDTSDRYASQVDNVLVEIESTVGKPKDVILKEVGFRSITNGFINPFEYTNQNAEPNIMHQAAAYQAILNSFHNSGFSWYKGIAFWDISVNEALHGPADLGFSPLGKEDTERVIKATFERP